MAKPKKESNQISIVRRWITVNEAAEYLSMHPVTVRRKIDKNEIPCSRIGRTIRIDLKRLDEMLKESEMKINSLP